MTQRVGSARAKERKNKAQQLESESAHVVAAAPLFSPVTSTMTFSR
jgi:hypothetical protein